MMAPDVNVTVLGMILQGGSFALLAWYFVFGLDKRDQAIKEQRQEFTAELRAERESRERQHQACEDGTQANTTALATVTSALSSVQRELQNLSDRDRTHPAPKKPATAKEQP